MAWKYVVSYACIILLILFLNDALTFGTFIDFNTRFRALVDELSIYFEPCGFPIELVTRFCEVRRGFEQLKQSPILNNPDFNNKPVH